MEALLQQLLRAPLPHDPDLLSLHARALECFGRLLAAKPSAVPAVIQRVCSLAHRIPIVHISAAESSATRNPTGSIPPHHHFGALLELAIGSMSRACHRTQGCDDP